MAAADPGGPAAPSPRGQGLVLRTGGDGSFSLFSQEFSEGFHSGRGALREARETFLMPSELERFQPGSTVRVLEVCFGTGCNLAVLLEACDAHGLGLDWTGLELDPEPLALALSHQAFRSLWQPETLGVLEQLRKQGQWPGETRYSAASDADALPREEPAGAGVGRGNAQGAAMDPPAGTGRALPRACADETREPRAGGSPWAGSPNTGSAVRTVDATGPDSPWRNSREPVPPASRGQLHWGDARQTLAPLRRDHAGRFDLIWHDAFSPQRCPQLWTLEFLTRLSRRLRPDGRWISYCSAAAVREALRLSGLQLAALQLQPNALIPGRGWSGGTVASPSPLPASPLWRPLSPMEQEHLACGAGEPYRDPGGRASADQIILSRQHTQAEALATGRRGSSSAWRRRWGVDVAAQRLH